MTFETPAPADRTRILVVDDSRLMRVAVRKILKDGFDLVEAADGEDGWDTLVHDPSIEVVISDLSMPHLDGFGLLQRIRNSGADRIREIPVVIITGNEDDEATKQKALAAGATDFVTKPFDSIQLRARMQAHARLDRTTRKLSEVSTALQESAVIDPLTRLANQRHFTQKGNEHLSFAKRHGTELSLIRLDLDNFNALFIKHGKRAADRILVKVGEALKTCIRQEDTAARIGVARFALLLPHSNLVGAKQLARRIHRQLDKPTDDGENPAVGFSMAIATPDIGPDTTLEAILGACKPYLPAAAEDRVPEPEHAALPAPKPAAALASADPENAAPAPPPAIGTAGIPELELGTALATLAEGEEERLVPHLPELARRLLPLLELCNRRLNLGLDDAIARLKARLAGHAETARPVRGANVLDR